jgi:DNA polymerase-3 subunit alpha (Gram-positive type)
MIKDGHNIPFATFLGFHAEKVPDIDLNFSSDYQAKAHNLTKVFLGEDNVYRAGTIETVAEKTAYGFALGYYESLGIDTSTINKAEITRLAIGCQDVKRTTGQHPGGIIVIPANMSVYDFSPIQYPADDVNAAWKTTHFDFHKIHDNVLKLDLLGHVDPTVLKILNDMTGIRPQDIPNDDHEVFSLFYTDKALKRHANFLGETTGALGLPEFGTALSRKMLIETKPHCFADLLIISGLSHGTDVWQGNAEDLINSGTCTLQEVIGCRDDIMNYLISMGVENSTSFKVMEMVRKGKGLTPEIEDMLREHQVPEYFITSFKKIKYLFPKAHAVAYVMMACRVAWFKVHMPLEYYAVYFTTRVDQFEIVTMSKGEKAIQKRLIELTEQQKTGKLSPKETEIFKCLQIALEMWERGYEIGMIDINKSIARYWVVDHENNKIIPPFNVMDGLGLSAAETVKEAREKRPFSSIEDLAARTKLSNQHIETLKKYGVLKDLPESDQLSLFDF